MTERISAELSLHGTGAAGSAPPLLHGRRCTACGHVFFPPQSYGCEACGAPPECLAAEELAGVGTLVASVEVLRHPLAPFTVGTVTLDAGPTVPAVVESPEGPLVPGTRMRAILFVAGDEAGHDVVDLRFAREDA